MLCQYEECIKEAQTLCESCTANQYMCTDHAESHLVSFKHHSIKLVSRSHLQSLYLESRKSEIKKCLIQITEDTQTMISIIKEVSNDCIRKLNEMNRNTSKTRKFEPVKLQGSRILILLQQSGLLPIDLNDWLEKEIKIISEEIKNSKKILDQKDQEIRRLQIELEKINQEKELSSCRIEDDGKNIRNLVSDEKNCELSESLRINDSSQIEHNEKSANIDDTKIDVEHKDDAQTTNVNESNIHKPISDSKTCDDDESKEVKNDIKNLIEEVHKFFKIEVQKNNEEIIKREELKEEIKQKEENEIEKLNQRELEQVKAANLEREQKIKVFNGLKLKTKRKHVSTKWTFIDGTRLNDREILLSYDGKYLFRCQL